MKFIIEHLSKKFEKKKFSEILIFPLKREKSTDCWEETEPAKQHCSTV